MPDDIKGEIPVPPSMSDVASGRSAERYAAKYERAGVISDVLLVMLTLLADHLDGFEFLESLLRDSNLCEDEIQRHKIVAIQRIAPHLAGWEPSSFQSLPCASMLRRAKAELPRR